MTEPARLQQANFMLVMLLGELKKILPKLENTEAMLVSTALHKLEAAKDNLDDACKLTQPATVEPTTSQKDIEDWLERRRRDA